MSPIEYLDQADSRSVFAGESSSRAVSPYSRPRLGVSSFGSMPARQNITA